MSDAPPHVDVPIIVFSFDRPAYLEAFCLSLRDQAGVTLRPEAIHLFQDGAVSRRSGVAYAKAEDLAASVEVFRRIFPAGQVHKADENLGIAFNILRGETYAFNTLNAECAYFFEDDLELGPHYLTAMEHLRQLAGQFPQIGYFAAYGDHYQNIRSDHVRITKLDHHWGFGLRRAAWQKIRDWMNPYYAALRRYDYQARNHVGIFETYLPRRVAYNYSSQDSFKTVACADLGIARIMTDVCFARYIGAKGSSFTPETFARLGYDSMTYRDSGPFTFEPVTEAQIAGIASAEFLHFSRYRAQEFETFLSSFRERVFNPERLITAEEIQMLFRVLLDRAADPQAIANNAGKKTVREYRAGFLRGQECRSKSF